MRDHDPWVGKGRLRAEARAAGGLIGIGGRELVRRDEVVGHPHRLEAEGLGAPREARAFIQSRAGGKYGQSHHDASLFQALCTITS